ncbi:hypothetical protein GCM10009801_18980 [Streptomyces albiaxialis]|uniref:Carrier domain-containing protein n=1 Tax=Streptomyces albiaxialis TaxID=329523 RepID=A0ABN2VSF6_9ACTN
MTSSVGISAQQLQDRLRDELSARFGVDGSEVTADTTFEALGLDSLALVELSDVLQGALGVSIADDDFTGEQRIADVVALLQEKLIENAAATDQA